MADSPKLAVLALNEIAKLLAKLTEEQLTDLVEGRAIVEFRTPQVTVASRPLKGGSGRGSPVLDAVLTAIKSMAEEDEVERYLIEHDKELSLPALRQLAEMIGLPVSSKGSKAVVRKNIAAGTAGLINRPASVFNTGWDR